MGRRPGDFDEWFAKLHTEQETPNAVQRAVLYAVRDRVLQEKALDLEGPGILKRLRGPSTVDLREEPLRGCCHGLLGTGNSRVIKWLVRMFTEALQWTHGIEFQCVAFQNTVAYAMGGSLCMPQGIFKLEALRIRESLTTQTSMCFFRAIKP